MEVAGPQAGFQQVQNMAGLDATRTTTRPRTQGGHGHNDRVVRGLLRLEMSVDDLRRQVEALPEVLRVRLAGNVGGASTPPMRHANTPPLPPPKGELQIHEDLDLSTGLDEILEPQVTVPMPAPLVLHRNVMLHKVFEECVAEMDFTSYQEVTDLGNSLCSSSAFLHGEESAGWSQFRQWQMKIHPASRVCVLLDALRVIFLTIDAFFVPYSLAYDDSLEGWFLYIAFSIFTFWCFDLMLCFMTGYIQPGGGVVMRWDAIACTYLKGNFFFDLIALVADGINLIAGLFPDEFSQGVGWQSVRILRVLKLSRLIRTVAKLNAGFAARVRSNFSTWIQVNGWLEYEYNVNFAMILLRLMFVIAWFGHLGSCIWHFLGQRVEDANAQSSWYQNGEHAYRQGLYWAIGTMFSGASVLRPDYEFEIIVSVLWIAMGAIFVTSFTSTLAATLIDANERQKEITRKNRLLASFMMQRKTPAILAVAVQNDFFEKSRAAQAVTEKDLPFLEMLDPRLRANLREWYHGRAFEQHDFFRMLKSLDSEIVKTLCLKACSCGVVKDGEEMFRSSQKVSNAILLTRGTMWYTYSPAPVINPRPPIAMKVLSSGLKQSTALRMPSASSSDTQKGVERMNTSSRTGSQPASTITASGRTRRSNALAVCEDSWICELAMFVSWYTLGSLEAEGTCELLLISTDAFIKQVTSNPILEAVVSGYAAQIARYLQGQFSSSSSITSDVDSGVDCDVIVCGLHPTVRGGLISQPVLQSLPRYGLTLRHPLRWKQSTLRELEEEVRQGKCHLSTSVDGEYCRVVLLVVLQLQNQDGRLCVWLAEQAEDGTCLPKFWLPGRKVEGTERPEEAVEKLLHTDLAPLAPAIHLRDQAKTVVEFGPSQSFAGMRTKYIKIVYTAVLEGRMVLGATQAPPSERSYCSSHHSPRANSALQLPARRTTLKTANAGIARATRVTLVGRRYVTWYDMDAARPSAFLASPFAYDGPDHAFAIVDHGDRDDHSVEASVQGSAYDIYRWMDPADFNSLLARRADVERELRWQMPGTAYLRYLADWTVKLDATAGFEDSYHLAGSLHDEEPWAFVV